MSDATLPSLHVGVPMWAHRPWIGRFLPAGTRSGGELVEYARRLNAVEGNTTFYASPSAATVERWRQQTPDGFRFVFKVPREITHERRLRDVTAPLGAFLDLLEPLGDRIGSLAIQLPPSFSPSELPALAALARSLPTSWRWCVEVRHPALFTGAAADALDRLLAGHGIERMWFDTTTLFGQPPASAAEREAWTKKPRVPVRREALTDRPVVRYLGRDDAAATIAGWQPWVPVVAQWIAEGRSPTFFVHTPDDLHSPELAQAFHAAVAERLPGLAPLALRRAERDADPGAALADPLAGQATLF